MGLSAERPDAPSKPVLVPDRLTARATYFSLSIIFVLWGAIYLAGIFSPALLDDVDTIHAEAAREMVQRHDWVTLYTDGIRYLEKRRFCIGPKPSAMSWLGSGGGANGCR